MGRLVERFYVLKDDQWGSHDTEEYMVEPWEMGSADKCPMCGGYISMLHWLEPRLARLVLHGTEFGDVVHSGSLLLVTSRFREAYQREGMAGLGEFGPVEIVKVKPKRLMPHCPTYFHVEVKRSRAALDSDASGLVCSEPASCEECRTTGIDAVARVVLEPNTWSGEDIFESRGLPGTNLVTERFKRICENSGITNVKFIPSEEYSFDFYPQRKLGTDPTVT
jgi:hypothetical protein